MLAEAQFMLVLFSVFVLLCIIVVLFGCVCGCRKTVPKNELMGLAGMVKLTNPDENVNFSPPPLVVQVNSVAVAAENLIIQTSEISKRSSNTVSSATRSLPDLPVESERLQASQSSGILWEAAEPNGDTSSELYATVDDNQMGGRGNGKKVVLQKDSTIESSYESQSQTDNSLSPYARVKREHPYDQLKQVSTDEHPYAQVKANGRVGVRNNPDPTLCQSTSSSLVDGPESPVAPARSRKSISLSQSSAASTHDIPAASAISGSIPANHELPYMTPPLTATTQQHHFSGDSQDSSKGYTSISVREPLSNILRQVPRRQELIDSHYATVSDDSDEMYAAIEEPNQAVYTSGSETYAQIRPMSTTVAASVNDVPAENLTSTSHVLTSVKNHSRQASSSSAASSTASPASPKPEKRQANSPLPRPPEAGNPALDEMYAKVMKKRISSQSVSSIDNEVSENQPSVSATSCKATQRSVSSEDDNNSVIAYESVNNNLINDSDMSCSGYETVAGEPNSLVPDYERVAGYRAETMSDSEPNYEELKPQDIVDCAYATVNKKRKLSPDYASLSRKESGYEQMEGFDPNYERVCRDSDPNYESIEKQEPPYEKVQASTPTPAYVPVYNQSSEEDVYTQVSEQQTDR